MDIEILDSDSDNGTMPNNVQELREAVVGRKIVSAAQSSVTDPIWDFKTTALVLTLDDGRKVELFDQDDCCAYTELKAFLLHPERVEHVITGVGTTDGYSTWHIYADMGEVLNLTVAWSAGNVGYYAYGFHIKVKDMEEDK